MAHHKSAKKRIRRNAKREEVNGRRIGRTRTFLKKLEAAIESGDKAAAQEAFKAAQPELHRGARLGVVSPNTAARRLSRLSARVKALG